MIHKEGQGRGDALGREVSSISQDSGASGSRPQISPGLFSPLFLDSLPPPPLCVGDSALSLFSPPTPSITVTVLSLHVPLFAVSLLPSLSPEAQDVLQIGRISLGAHRHLRLDKGKTKLSPFLPHSVSTSSFGSL